MPKKQRLSYEEKLKIMYQYLKKNNAFETGIRARTKFGKYPVGQWQANMRKAYYAGRLDLSEELEEKFLAYGILRKEKERETAAPMTWDQKFEIMKKYLTEGKESQAEIDENTVFEGYPIGVWQRTIRHLFYSGELHTVSPELEKQFFECGILRLEKKRPNNSRAKYSYEEKLNIMVRFLSENDAFKEGIRQDTVFEGNPIGAWQDYMRQRYYQGKLRINSKLEQQFLGYGILKKGKNTDTKGKISDENDEVQQLVQKILKKEEERKALDEEIAKLRKQLREKGEAQK